jgi:hypothetical protein
VSLSSVMMCICLLFFRHCEERSDEAIQGRKESLDCFASLAMTAKPAHDGKS